MEKEFIEKIMSEVDNIERLGLDCPQTKFHCNCIKALLETYGDNAK